ncbi:MAG TPA: Cof-type HAD-IIB family hydrolase [Bacilli bacterium]
MMPFKRPYRMIVTDIDGTLVDTQQMISAENKTKIYSFQQQGGIVTLATGRMEDATRRFVQDLNIRHPVILYNGGKIVDFTTGQCLFEAVLAEDVIRALIRLLEANPHNMIFYSEKKLWVKEITPTLQDYMKKDQVQCSVWKTPEFLLQSKVNKILIIREDRNFSAVRQALEQLTGRSCELVQSEPTYLEVLPQGVSKGRALQMLVDHLGIDIREVIAIGDNLNDLDMILKAGLGVAVSNAHPKLKEHAQYIASSHLDHAVADVIEKYCLPINR